MINTLRATIATLAAAAILAGCGGGGGGQSAAPHAAPQQTHTGPAAQSVTIKINIPGKSPAGKRRTKYVGMGTESADFSVQLAGASPSPTTTVNCTTTCQTTLAVFPGSNTFTVSLYDAPGGGTGGGNLLSTGTTTQTIAAGTNTVNLTFNGVPAAVEITFNPTSLPSGTAATATGAVTVVDADGNTIISPGGFVAPSPGASPAPIPLLSDQTYVTFTPSSLADPTVTSVTLNYDGTTVGSTTNVNISATINGAPSPVTAFPITVGGAGVSLNPSSVTVSSGIPTATVTVTDTGYNGAFTIINDTCTGPGYTTISPLSGVGMGPSQVYTITWVMSAGGPPCSYGFSDGTTSSTLLVTAT